MPPHQSTAQHGGGRGAPAGAVHDVQAGPLGVRELSGDAGSLSQLNTTMFNVVGCMPMLSIARDSLATLICWLNQSWFIGPFADHVWAPDHCVCLVYIEL